MGGVGRRGTKRASVDAEHIVPDRLPEGIATVRNGLAMCPTHHREYDQNVGEDTGSRFAVIGSNTSTRPLRRRCSSTSTTRPSGSRRTMPFAHVPELLKEKIEFAA